MTDFTLAKRVFPITLTALLLLASTNASAAGATEFCIDGKFDLGARYQGIEPKAGEVYPTRWCISTDNESERVHFSVAGNSNADMENAFTIVYLPPAVVRIVDYQPGHNIEFVDVNDPAEGVRARRADPRRLLSEFRSSPQSLEGVDVTVEGDKVTAVRTTTELPYRGSTTVEWLWNWEKEEEPVLRLLLGGTLIYTGTGRWRTLSDDEASDLWAVAEGSQVHNVPGENWPSRVNMSLQTLADDVYLVNGVRTGFQHLVIDTSEGLVIADAPAGWVEMQHIPPTELVPGLGVSGLSERFVDFLAEELPERPVRAVALTHFHDDHAGGARAFAAAGGEVYASANSAAFIEESLNVQSMRGDRLGDTHAKVMPVGDAIIIGAEGNHAKIVSMGPSPHSFDTLGLWAVDKGFFFVSDVHVPGSEADAPEEKRARSECWFAGWAVEHLPEDVLIINTHSSAQTPVSRLAKYLESDVCRGESVN